MVNSSKGCDMYKELIEYTNIYKPLTLDEQAVIIDKELEDCVMIDIMIKYCAISILSEINKWTNTIRDVEDIASLSIIGFIRGYNKWKRNREFLLSFYCKLHISAYLHKQYSKYFKPNELLFDNIDTIEEYINKDDIVYYDETVMNNDNNVKLMEELKRLLTIDEFKFIYNIYYNNLNIKDSAKGLESLESLNLYSKHNQLIKMLYNNVSQELNIFKG
jgi:hypothetical protein